ncbi:MULTISPECIES: carboxylating nicotinate-nucleotide diphosphorylase [unclassified Neisseria]|uniref:carboxylating nicotinate-nucleotide diphosphorylase n=1 Tax=unclassified Neisseria TaxID=2623750 RepID=UPI0026651140|nr:MULTISPECIES: carboxylating nicotinate-nucleotide diphosphorylase [unclassified Neisseria]MDO1509769.1 carboxylating nicotinate-nucleotide diphosphorylase [Neisseria sp. MVDL19-042950]MDO1515907.1 carboxylating nicotinate-nucleotide diphosphorylase [Neisseria sp. MVDL18-041461]MDO1563020.1 carboxylating nicotinate-nucleotide diphosphorylase [Neisseria sp. MVDL20-010259]
MQTAAVSPLLFPLPDVLLKPLVREALSEDLGRRGDITSAAVISAGMQAELAIVSRENGILAGMDLARLAFAETDASIMFQALAADGANILAGQVLATVKGSAHALLTAERTALNYLTHLSGIASMTAAAVAEIKDYPTHITCSRKTIPGLRTLQKYAVRAGGGCNHRMGLDDAILIKDNHLIYSGGLMETVKRAKQLAGHLIPVEVEVDTLEQLEQALAGGADLVLLDNMDNETLKQAVAMCCGRARCEASGGIKFNRLREVAATGVDFIALGYLTHSSRALDIGLDFIAG